MYGGKIDKGTVPILGGSPIASNADGAETDLPVRAEAYSSSAVFHGRPPASVIPINQLIGKKKCSDE